MDTASVKRLATNPLLLTILVLIYENVGKLPNRRAKLYETCTKTLLESWRQEQTKRQSKLLDDLGGEGEQIVTRVVAALAYWLHEKYPGGAAPLKECHDRLLANLTEDEGYERSRAQAIADGLLSFASCEAGLLCERGLGRYGFFHLTFEEYLAAYHLARRDPRERTEMIAAHWEDDRWREVLLLAAGVLGVVDGNQSDASAYVTSLRQLEPNDPADTGRGAMLAGRALADIGLRNVNPATRRDVLRDLRVTMQDLHPDTERPNEPSVVIPRLRYAAGEALDELGWLPDDLDAWVLCPKCADGGRDLLATKYPITNTQFARFIQAGGYENWDYWGGKDSPGWRWPVKGERRWLSAATDQPEYWNDPRFGKDRRGYPVVGVSWYEAAAYAVWLTEQLRIGDFGLRIVSLDGINPQSLIRNASSACPLTPNGCGWPARRRRVSENAIPGTCRGAAVSPILRARRAGKRFSREPTRANPASAARRRSRCIPWGKASRSGCGTWPATYGNGWIHGLTRIEVTVWCGAGRGATIRGSPGRSSAPGTFRTSRSGFSGSAWSPPLVLASDCWNGIEQRI